MCHQITDVELSSSVLVGRDQPSERRKKPDKCQDKIGDVRASLYCGIIAVLCARSVCVMSANDDDGSPLSSAALSHRNGPLRSKDIK